MSELREAIEKYGVKCGDSADNDTYGNFEAGFTAALDLLWPCVERIEKLVAANYGNRLDENALKELKAKVGG